MMDNEYWRPTPPAMDGDAAGGGGGDWRTQLPPASRERIVSKIVETLKRHFPVDGPEGFQELKRIAVRFEEKVYAAASCQNDYLKKISLKMLTMETKPQNTMPNALPSNCAGNSSEPPPDSGEDHDQVEELSEGGESEYTSDEDLADHMDIPPGEDYILIEATEDMFQGLDISGNMQAVKRDWPKDGN